MGNAPLDDGITLFSTTNIHFNIIHGSILFLYKICEF